MKGLKCPNCGYEGGSKVVQTIKLPDKILRVRRCENCGKQFDTIEKVVED